MPLIDRNSPVPFYQQVYEQIVNGIESGLYPSGKKLPSIRECARDLAVSNTTIELAYQRLVEEGYILAKRGSGYTICTPCTPPANKHSGFSESYRESLQKLDQQTKALESLSAPLYDFAYDAVDASTFPFATWARACREVFFGVGADAACLYNDRQGLKELRSEIARYVGGEFGVVCVADQVLVMPTTRDLVSEIIMLFNPSETTVAMEEPGYDEVEKNLNMRGYTVQPLRIHPFPTRDEVEAMLKGANVVFVTPACQFPTNRSMSVEMRTHLVEWAEQNNAYIIDDEYGWEFQLGMARTPSLAQFDKNGHVITLGTFSNSFTPAISLSYAILPPQLMVKWRDTRRNAHPQVPWQTQAAMVAFMRDEHWRAHVRKNRTSMKRKRQQFIASLQAYMGESIEIVEGTSSLFVLVKTLDGRPEEELISNAAQLGVRIYPTSRYWSGDIPSDWRYVLVGYAGIPLDSIDDGIKTLAKSWGL